MFFNNFYLVRNKASVQASKYYETEGLNIPQGALNIKISFDGKYIGYIFGGNLEIFNVASEQKVLEKLASEVSFYRWLPDRDMIILSKEITLSTSKSIEIKTIDVSNRDERNYPQILNLQKSDGVMGIELSPLTNMVYIKIKNEKSKMDIYKYDILDNLKFVCTVNSNTTLKLMNLTDTLVYRDDSDSLIIKNGTNNHFKKVTFKKDSKLIGNDFEDNIYMGELNKEGKISKVFCLNGNGQLNNTFKPVTLKSSYTPENICISEKGDVYCINERSIYIANRDIDVTFSGHCVDIAGNYVAILDKARIKIEEIQI